MDSSATLILAIALFVIMIGMGLSLTLADFRRVLQMPKAVLIGFLNQIILLPLIGYGLSVLLGVDPAIAIGVMILAACPGGPTSNLVTHLAKGDIALSVTLTAVNSLLTILTIPLIITFALNTFLGETTTIEAPIGTIIGSLIAIIAVPLVIGMLVKRYAPAFAARMEKPVRIASGALITLVIMGLIIKERAHIMEYFGKALAITVALNVATMVVGYLTAKLGKLSLRQALTIAIESGNQNGTLAISLAVVTLARPEFAIPAAVYSIMMYVTASVVVYWGNRQAAS